MIKAQLQLNCFKNNGMIEINQYLKTLVFQILYVNSDDSSSWKTKKSFGELWVHIRQRSTSVHRHFKINIQQSEGCELIHQDDSVNPPLGQVPWQQNRWL